MCRLTSLLTLLVCVLSWPHPGNANWDNCDDSKKCTCNATKKEVNCQSLGLKAVPSGIPADTKDPDGVTCSSGDSVNKVTNKTLDFKCAVVENNTFSEGDSEEESGESPDAPWPLPTKFWTLNEFSCDVAAFSSISLCAAHLLLGVMVLSLISSLVKMLPPLP
uniref:Variable lymphocyte receptor A n=1 Tax=Geotria australis TaxID=71168 RepID=A0A8K1T239_9VERT|nr:variable lymphocyte receptor A [Geotria australis]